MLGLINFHSSDFLTTAPLHFRWPEKPGPGPVNSQLPPANPPFCITLDGTCRWHYLLHNNEVRNVTNQNTRQHRDKLGSVSIPSIFFIIIIYFWGRIVGIFSVHLSAASELKRLRFYCHGRVSSGGRNCDYSVLKGWTSRTSHTGGKNMKCIWPWRTGSNIQQMRNDILPLIFRLGQNGVAFINGFSWN